MSLQPCGSNDAALSAGACGSAEGGTLVEPSSGPQGVSLGSIFASFLRLGLTAFGGPAMVAYIRDMAVRKRRWLSEETFKGGVALCQSIPGATAMQTAAYVGLRARGPLGALAAFVGFGLPAFVLMVALSAAYARTYDIGPVVSAFRGLQVIVVALIANAALAFGRSSVRNWRDVVLAAGAAVFLALHGAPVIGIAVAAALGMVLYRGSEAVAHSSASTANGASRSPRFAGALALIAAVGLGMLFFADHRLFDLSALMIKVDLFAFGGGFASVPLMLHEVVDVRHWITSKTFVDGIALGQVTPGPIVITATFIGYQVAGMAGAIIATVSIFSPSFLMVLVTVPYFDRLQRSVVFRRALRGVLVSFVGLLLAVTVAFARETSWAVPSAILAVSSFAALRMGVDIVWVVSVGALVSIFIL